MREVSANSLTCTHPKSKLGYSRIQKSNDVHNYLGLGRLDLSLQFDTSFSLNRSIMGKLKLENQIILDCTMGLLS